MISKLDRDSPKNKNAKNATNPGVRISRGRALLISRFFIPSITQRKASAPRKDLRSNTIIPDAVRVEKSMKKKKGIAMIKLNIATNAENPRAVSLNKTFFWVIAAIAENTADVNEKIYQGIIFFF